MTIYHAHPFPYYARVHNLLNMNFPRDQQTDAIHVESLLQLVAREYKSAERICKQDISLQVF